MHIQTAVDLGIIGVLFLWLMLAYIIAVGAKVAVNKDNMSERGMTAALFATCFIVALDTVIHGWLYSAGSQFTIMFHVAFVCMLQAMAQWTFRRRRAASHGPGGMTSTVGVRT